MADSQEIQVQEAEKQEVVESGVERTRAQRAFVPRVDIYETEDAIAVMADMPGVDAESLDISLEQSVLTINGLVDPTAPEGYALAYAEYRTGDYVRSFTLSNQIDQSAIEASIKDGVLRLHLPKVRPTTKKITVSAA
jgi:HSP20 family molecular chaperone IbpA